jgi:hypothetical protein
VEGKEVAVVIRGRRRTTVPLVVVVNTLFFATITFSTIFSHTAALTTTIQKNKNRFSKVR